MLVRDSLEYADRPPAIGIVAFTDDPEIAIELPDDYDQSIDGRTVMPARVPLTPTSPDHAFELKAYSTVASGFSVPTIPLTPSACAAVDATTNALAKIRDFIFFLSLL